MDNLLIEKIYLISMKTIITPEIFIVSPSNSDKTMMIEVKFQLQPLVKENIHKTQTSQIVNCP